MSALEMDHTNQYAVNIPLNKENDVNINRADVPLNVKNRLSSGYSTASSKISDYNACNDTADVFIDNTTTLTHEQNSVSDRSMEERLNIVEERVNFVPKLQDELVMLKDRVSLLETDLVLSNGFFKVQTVVNDKIITSQRQLIKNLAIHSSSVSNELKLMKKSIDMLGSNLDSCKPAKEKEDQPISCKNTDTYATDNGCKGEESMSQKLFETKSNDTSRSSNLTTCIVNGLRRQKNTLRSLLHLKPSDLLDKSTILDAYGNITPAVQKESHELQAILKDYAMTENPNIQLIKDIENILDEANEWCIQIRKLYYKKEFYRKSQGTNLYSNLSRFSPESDMDIFEFLRRFESLASEYEVPAEKSELFFHRFLSESLQDEMEMVRDDYERMKSILIHKYGYIEILTDQILAPLVATKKPTQDSDLQSKVAYYRKLQSALHKINKLLQCQDLPKDEAESFLFSQSFLRSILCLLPDDAVESFIGSMSSLNQDIVRIHGMVAYKLILSTVTKLYEKFDSIQSNTQETNGLVHSSADNRNSTKEQVEILKKPDHSSKIKTYKKREKPVSKQKYPCTLKGHNHSIVDCAEFFTASSKKRAEQRTKFRYKHCFLCLQSSRHCNGRYCENLKTVPDALKCSVCMENYKNRRGASHSVLYCYKRNHPKASQKDILCALNDYLPNFDLERFEVNLSV